MLVTVWWGACTTHPQTRPGEGAAGASGGEGIKRSASGEGRGGGGAGTAPGAGGESPGGPLGCQFNAAQQSPLGGLSAVPEFDKLWAAGAPTPGSDKEHPIMRCGFEDSYDFVANIYRCARGKNPLEGNIRGAQMARRGNVGANWRQHIIDVYEVPCADGPERVFVDLYGCPESEARLHRMRNEPVPAEEVTFDPLPEDAATAFREANRQRQGDPAGALLQARRALAIVEQAQGAKHPNVARILNVVGLTAMRSEGLAPAEEAWNRAFAIWQAAGYPLASAAADTYLILSFPSRKRGQHALSECLLQRALAVYEKLSGPFDSSVRNALTGLAEVYRENGQAPRAERLLRRALASVETAMGPRHPDVAEVLQSLAEHYEATGQASRAAEMKGRAAAIPH